MTSWIFPFGFIFILGLLAVHAVTLPAAIRHRALLTASLAFPAGASLCSIALFLAYCLHPQQGFFTALLFCLFLMCFFLIQIVRRPSQTADSPTFPLKNAVDFFLKKSRREKVILVGSFCIFIFLLIKLFDVFKNVSLQNIFGGWDAHFFWNLKAKFYFRSPELWRNVFASDLNWAHPDYPLLLPGSVAWGWLWNGRELQIWPSLIAFGFLISYISFVVWFLTSEDGVFTGLWGGSFFMTLGAFLFWSPQQYADVPVSFFITSSAALLFLWSRHQHSSILVLSSALAGSAAWTKNEGLLFVGWFTILLGLIVRKTARSHENLKKTAKGFLLSAALPLLCAVGLKIFLAPHGDYLGSGRSFSDYFSALLGDPGKTLTILKGFGIYMVSHSSWNGLWFLFGVAYGFYWIIPSLRRSDCGMLAHMALMILLGYFLVLHTSPHNIIFQIQTAMERLLLHAAGIAVLFTFEIFARLTQNRESLRLTAARSE